MRTKKRKRRTRTRIGSLLLALLFAQVCLGGEKPAKAASAYALISGTVFREPGFALPAVDITLEPAPAEKTSKMKKMKAVSDRRGEFVFRVPAAPMRYSLSFRAKGLAEESRFVSIQGEERQDVFVTLKPAKEGSQ